MGIDIKAHRFFDILAVAAVLLLLNGYFNSEGASIEGGWSLVIILIIAFLAYMAIKKRVWD